MPLTFAACSKTPEPVEAPAGETGSRNLVDNTVSGLDARPANPTCTAPARPPSGGDIELRPAFANLTFTLPVALLQVPDDDSRFFVLEKNGVVRSFANEPNASTTSVFVDIRDRVMQSRDPNFEGGLLGMAFSPRFDENGLVYLSYTAPTSLVDDAGDAFQLGRVSRFKSRDGGRTLDPASEEVLLEIEDPFSNHNGGWITFGPDGLLYIGVGDGGLADDPLGNGQKLTTLMGKMLRIDVNQDTGYAIPASNPFASSGGGLPEIYAWGLRNPWRFSFDRATGQLWAGDVGQDRIEEIDVIVNGGNYGWDVREGNICHEPRNNCATAGLIDPVSTYTRAVGRSITGGFVYRGSDMPNLAGTYIYADFVTGVVQGLFFDAAGAPAPRTLADTDKFISSFGEDNQGELYLFDYGTTGRILKLAPAGTPAVDTFPKLLSQTGCVDPNDATKPASGVIPYDVALELWSDGAAKERFLGLPDGKTAHVADDGHLDLPIGTVLVKSFRVDDRLVETRLFVRHDDGGWAGYSYEWNDAQTDAVLLPAGKTRALANNKTWTFPSRNDCLACHTEAAGRSLGLEVAQLNSEMAYPNGRTANQLVTLDRIGALDAPIGDVTRLRHFPAVDDAAAPIEDRARAYLHVNCANCHQPGGTGRGEVDFRIDTPFKQMGLCDAAPREGTLGDATAKIVKPGDPAHSMISMRMKRRGANQMPALGTAIVDPVGTATIDQWITSLTGCP